MSTSNTDQDPDQDDTQELINHQQIIKDSKSNFDEVE